MRAVLMRPDAVPDRAVGTLATATAFIGPTLRPSPQPTASNALAISTRLSLSGIRASMSRPSPISPMPAVMGTRGPSLLAMRPESCATACPRDYLHAGGEGRINEILARRNAQQEGRLQGLA